jgi:hypothetical protein
MGRKCCKICGADVGSSEFDICGRHACQRAALHPTRCRHCRVVGRGEVCPECADLLRELGDTVVEPPPPKQSLRDRLAEAGVRRLHVWLEGQADLLRRCATAAPEWARPQH